MFVLASGPDVEVSEEDRNHEQFLDHLAESLSLKPDWVKRAFPKPFDNEMHTVWRRANEQT